MNDDLETKKGGKMEEEQKPEKSNLIIGVIASLPTLLAIVCVLFMIVIIIPTFMRHNMSKGYFFFFGWLTVATAIAYGCRVKLERMINPYVSTLSAVMWFLVAMVSFIIANRLQ